MKKTVLILMLGVLFIASNIFAADGDFIVEGNVGIGTPTPSAALDVRGAAIFNENGDDFDFRIEGDTNPNLFHVDAGNDVIGIGNAGWSGAIMYVTPTDKYGLAVLGSQVNSANMLGASYRLDFMASSNKTSTIGFNNQVTIDSDFETAPTAGTGIITFGTYSVGTSTWTSMVKGLDVYLNRSANNSRNFTLNGGVRLINVKTKISGGSGTITGSDFTGVYIEDFDDFSFTNKYGLYLEKQTAGTNRYGIVLAGDGVGADLVLGMNKETKLYGSSGNLIVDTLGKVGIGTTTAPTEKLEVAGAIKIANSSSSCNQANAGAIRFVSPDFQGCNGSAWVKLNN